jgi:hypothetical protein
VCTKHQAFDAKRMMQDIFGLETAAWCLHALWFPRQQGWHGEAGTISSIRPWVPKGASPASAWWLDRTKECRHKDAQRHGRVRHHQRCRDPRCITYIYHHYNQIKPVVAAKRTHPMSYIYRFEKQS